MALGISVVLSTQCAEMPAAYPFSHSALGASLQSAVGKAMEQDLVNQFFKARDEGLVSAGKARPPCNELHDGTGRHRLG